jgi:hypothetical protein
MPRAIAGEGLRAHLKIGPSLSHDGEPHTTENDLLLDGSSLLALAARATIHNFALLISRLSFRILWISDAHAHAALTVFGFTSSSTTFFIKVNNCIETFLGKFSDVT